MRVALVSSLLVVIACGGSKKPAETASSDTSSTETSAPESKDLAPPQDSTTAPSASASAPAPAPSASDAPSEAPAASNHSVHTVTGAIDGKPFAPKLARVVGPKQKDGRVLLSIDERADCASGAHGKPGDASITVLVPWEDGYKVDIGSLKRSGKKGPGEIGFARINAGGKKEVSTTFKPSGRVTIVKAPTEQNAIGKMKVDLQSGDYMLAGDLDIQVCTALK